MPSILNIKVNFDENRNQHSHKGRFDQGEFAIPCDIQKRHARSVTSNTRASTPVGRKHFAALQHAQARASNPSQHRLPRSCTRSKWVVPSSEVFPLPCRREAPERAVNASVSLPRIRSPEMTLCAAGQMEENGFTSFDLCRDSMSTFCGTDVALWRSARAIR